MHQRNSDHFDSNLPERHIKTYIGHIVLCTSKFQTYPYPTRIFVQPTRQLQNSQLAYHEQSLAHPVRLHEHEDVSS